MNNLALLCRLRTKANAHPQDVGLLSDLFEMTRIIEPVSPGLAHKVNADVRRLAMQNTRTRGCERSYLLLKRALLFDALVDFDAYCQYLEYDRDANKRFYLPRRRQIVHLVRSLQALDDGQLELLTISLPPGIGKTTLAIFFLSREMGKFPEKPNLASAHADKLTRSIYDGVRAILTDEEYLWKDIFPHAGVLTTNAKDETLDLGPEKRFKSLTCRSIDSGLTGATRAENILYSDDLVSGIEEAMSKERMDTLWTKYQNDLKSRKKMGCKELHVATRWSIHDPIGRLEIEHEKNPSSLFIKQPALNENDESNFDYLNRVGFDTKYFHDMRAGMDDISWRCLFQQEPIEREGQLYPEDTLRRYYDLPNDMQPDAIVGICDTAEGGGDDTFLPVGYLYGDDIYIEDCVCDPGLPEITVPLCSAVLLKHQVQRAQFESNSAGGGFADKVQEEVKKKNGVTHITKKRTTENKQTKIIINSDFVKKNFLFKDKTRYEPRSPYARMMRLLTGYTITGKMKHDDVPDGMAQLAKFVAGLKGNSVTVFKRPF